jgi:hypothetical protein
MIAPSSPLPIATVLTLLVLLAPVVAGCTHVLGDADRASLALDVAQTDRVYGQLAAWSDAGALRAEVKSVHCDERAILRRSGAEPDAGSVGCPQ